MYLIGVIALLLGGMIGTYYGLVDDLKWAFALGVLGVAASVISMFGGRILPEKISLGISADAPEWVRETVFVSGVVVAFLVGTAGMVLAFTEDSKWAMLFGLLVIAGAVITIFRGRWPSLQEMGLREFTLHEEDGSLTEQRRLRAKRVDDARFAGGVAVALLAGTVGTFLAFSEDTKVYFIIGQGIVVLAVFTMFLGRIPGLKKADS
ncbi:MAG: hypothetical protein V3S25_10635 [Nitrospirales bacterium]